MSEQDDLTNRVVNALEQRIADHYRKSGRIRVPSPNVRAIFVAGARREAEYWARSWGFQNRREWIFASRMEHVMGLHNRDDTVVFVCGSRPIEPDLVERLQSGGFTTFVDAHDIDTNRELRSALDLL